MEYTTFLRTEADLQTISTTLLETVREELQEWHYSAEMKTSFDDLINIIKFIRDADTVIPLEFIAELEVMWKTQEAYNE